ncbi:MAG: preprotein translocase subunit YajC [Vagococcus sp.]
MMWENILYSSIALIIIIVFIAVVMYVINLKNLKAQKSHYKSVHENLSIGKKVIVLNGIYGEVAKVNQDTIDLRLKSGQLMEVSRYAVTKIID